MKKIFGHILFWIVILFWRANGDYVGGVPIYKFILHNLVRLPVMIIATYFLMEYILPKYLIKDKNYWKLLGLFGLNFFVATALDRMIITSNWFETLLDISSYREYTIFTETHPYRYTFMLFAIMGLASLIRFFQLYIEKEKTERELQEEHLNTKLAFLKAQVNPHFLFNALNNIYSMAVQKDQTEIAAGLENLSGIMHYLTYESNAQLVPLEKEIDLLKNYIDIQHLRVADSDDTTISFSVEGDLKDQQIAPVVLLPIVENAFKHGIKPDQKCLVSIQLRLLKNDLVFKTTNTFFEKSEKEIQEKGIGIDNVSKRLQMIYPEQHTYKSFEKDDYFYTELRLQLNKL